MAFKTKENINIKVKDFIKLADYTYFKFNNLYENVISYAYEDEEEKKLYVIKIDITNLKEEYFSKEESLEDLIEHSFEVVITDQTFNTFLTIPLN